MCLADQIPSILVNDHMYRNVIRNLLVRIEPNVYVPTAGRISVQFTYLGVEVSPRRV